MNPIDTSMLLLLGKNANEGAKPPIYDAAGVVRDSVPNRRSKRGIEETPNEELIVEQCSEEGFQCLIRAATFAHMKAFDFETSKNDGTFESTLRKESTSCRQVYSQCLASKDQKE